MKIKGFTRAIDGARTRGLDLGKVARYQLRHYRIFCCVSLCLPRTIVILLYPQRNVNNFFKIFYKIFDWIFFLSFTGSLKEILHFYFITRKKPCTIVLCKASYWFSSTNWSNGLFLLFSSVSDSLIDFVLEYCNGHLLSYVLHYSQGVPKYFCYK